MNFRHGGNCGCPKQIVHPTKHNCVHCCTESVVEHVHPVHTTVINHHLERNRHVFPHSTSTKNTLNCVDEFGGACNVPPKQGVDCQTGNYGGGMNDGFGGHGHPNHHGPHHGQPNHYGHHHGQQYGHWGHHHHGQMNNWKKPNQWC